MKFLCFDTGIGMENARRLVEDGNDVYYAPSWQEPYSKFERAAPGMGFGFKMVLNLDYPYPNLEKTVDQIVITDLCLGRAEGNRALGRKVFGGGPIERLELDRVFNGKLMDDLGVSRPKSIAIKGTDKLKEYLKTKDKCVVKLNIFRGDRETWTHHKYIDSLTKIRDLEAKVNEFAREFIFVCEDFSEGNELGVDLWYRKDGSFCRPYFVTLENHKNGATVGRWTEKSIWDPYLAKFGRVAEKYKYTGPFSLEGFVQGKKILITDITARPCYPGSMIFIELMKDWGKFIYDDFKKLELKANDEYSCCANLFTDYKDQWLTVNIPKGAKIQYRLRRATKDKVGNIFSVPGSDLIVTVVASDHTPEGALKTAQGYLEKIEVDGGSHDSDIAKDFDLSILK